LFRGSPETSSTKREAVSVPVDGQLMIADDFVMTPEKKAHVDKANESLKSGSHTKAIEELRLGDIDVNYTRLWMPMASSRERLEQAIRLTRDGKFYEANLALKAIEDNLFVDSVNINELRKSPGHDKCHSPLAALAAPKIVRAPFDKLRTGSYGRAIGACCREASPVNGLLQACAKPLFACPTPDSRLPTPDSRLSTLDSRLSTLDSRLPTPDSRLPTPGF
jgi:hypothetical protein